MKWLITGINGFLGARIARYYQGKHECITPDRRELDIRNKAECQRFLALHRPDYVIHTAAVSDVTECERNPDLSLAVNVLGTQNLAEACREVSGRLVLMSSDQVYLGGRTDAAHDEQEECRPVNVYGRHKLEAEQRVLDRLPDAVVLRLTWMYDLPAKELGTKPNFLTRLIAAAAGGPGVAFSPQEYRGITYVREVVENMENVFAVPGGIYNFGSTPAESTYALAQQVLAFLGQMPDKDMLNLQEGLKPRNLAMNPQRLNQQNIYFSGNVEGIKRCLGDYGESIGLQVRQ